MKARFPFMAGAACLLAAAVGGDVPAQDAKGHIVKSKRLVVSLSGRGGIEAVTFDDKDAGVFPMGPFPGNDHSLRPGEWVDKRYLDYGPHMTAMRGRKWMLEPHVIRVPDADARANIFDVPGGDVIPVVYAGDAGKAKVVLRSEDLFSGDFVINAIRPGVQAGPVLSNQPGTAAA